MTDEPEVKDLTFEEVEERKKRLVAILAGALTTVNDGDHDQMPAHQVSEIMLGALAYVAADVLFVLSDEGNGEFFYTLLGLFHQRFAIAVQETLEDDTDALADAVPEGTA